MLWDLIQQAQIGQAKSQAQEAKSVANDAQQTTRHLQNRIQTLEESLDRLSLASMAIAEILRERFGVTEDAIEAKVQEIDLRDGKLDGRLVVGRNQCSKCRHENASVRRKCLYCGEPLAVGSGLFIPLTQPQPKGENAGD